jgi:hypothetical protein
MQQFPGWVVLYLAMAVVVTCAYTNVQSQIDSMKSIVSNGTQNSDNLCSKEKFEDGAQGPSAAVNVSPESVPAPAPAPAPANVLLGKDERTKYDYRKTAAIDVPHGDIRQMDMGDEVCFCIKRNILDENKLDVQEARSDTSDSDGQIVDFDTVDRIDRGIQVIDPVSPGARRVVPFESDRYYADFYVAEAQL